MSDDSHMRTIEAPFTAEQVDGLNWYQHHAPMHPFTCGRRDDGKHLADAVLIASSEGWFCPHCEYKQKWAWEMMADPSNFPSLFG